MIALRFAGHPSLARDLRQALLSQMSAERSTPVIVLSDDSASTHQLSSADLLVTSPIPENDLAASGSSRPKTDSSPWLVVSPAPSFEEAIVQLSLGAGEYLPCEGHLDTVAMRVLDAAFSHEHAPKEAWRLETILSLFDADPPENTADWTPYLGQVAGALGVDVVALLVPGEEVRRFPPDTDRTSMQEFLSFPCPLGPRGQGILALGRFLDRQTPIERIAFPGAVLGRLLGQHMLRADLHSKVLGAKQEWEATADAIRDPIVVLEPSGQVARANLAFATLVSRRVQDVVEEPINALCGLPVTDGWWKIPPPAPDAVVRTIAFPVSSERLFQIHPQPLGHGRPGSIVYLRDVTEERRLMSLVMQRERFAALGELADGVFHDLNNLASSLQPELVCARQTVAPISRALVANHSSTAMSDELREDLDVLQQSLDAAVLATHRLEQVLNNLRQYSRLRQDSGNADEPVPVDLNQLLLALPVLFNARARLKSATLRLDLGDIPLVEGNSSELLRVFENLLKNALDAVPVGGLITVVTTLEGECVRAEVRDNGQGVAPELIERIFERGFTTRRAEGGSGLGLSICRDVLRSHGGDLHVTSTPGVSTSFVARIPLFQDNDFSY